MTFPQIRTSPNSPDRPVRKTSIADLLSLYDNDLQNTTITELELIALAEDAKNNHGFGSLLEKRPDLAYKFIINSDAVVRLCAKVGRGIPREERIGRALSKLSILALKSAIRKLARSLLEQCSKKEINEILEVLDYIYKKKKTTYENIPYGNMLRKELLSLKPILPTNIYYFNKIVTKDEVLGAIGSCALPIVVIMRDAHVDNVTLFKGGENDLASFKPFPQFFDENKASGRLSLEDRNVLFRNVFFRSAMEVILEQEEIANADTKHSLSEKSLKDQTEAFLSSILDTGKLSNSFISEWSLRQALSSLRMLNINRPSHEKEVIKSRVFKFFVIGFSAEDINLAEEEKFIFGESSSEISRSLTREQLECVANFLLTTSNIQAWSFFEGIKSSDPVEYKSPEDRDVLISLLYDRLQSGEILDPKVYEQAQKFLKNQQIFLRDHLWKLRAKQEKTREEQAYIEERARKLEEFGDRYKKIEPTFSSLEGSYEDRLTISRSMNFLSDSDISFGRFPSATDLVPEMDALRRSIQSELNEARGDNEKILSILRKFSHDLTSKNDVFQIWLECDSDSSFESKLAIWRNLFGLTEKLESENAITIEMVVMTLKETVLPSQRYLWVIVEEQYKGTLREQKRLIDHFGGNIDVLSPTTIKAVSLLVVKWNLEISVDMIVSLFGSQQNAFESSSQASTESFESLSTDEESLESSLNTSQISLSSSDSRPPSQLLLSTRDISSEREEDIHSLLLSQFLERELSDSVPSNEIFILLKKFPAGFERAVEILVKVVNDEDVAKRAQKISRLIEVLEMSAMSGDQLKIIFDTLRDVLITQNGLLELPKHTTFNEYKPEDSEGADFYKIQRLLITSLINDIAAQLEPNDILFSILVKNVFKVLSHGLQLLLSLLAESTQARNGIYTEQRKTFIKWLFFYLVNNLSNQGSLDVARPLISNFLKTGLTGKKEEDLDKIVSGPVSENVPRVFDFYEELFKQLFLSISAVVELNKDLGKQLFEVLFLEHVRSGEKNNKLLWILKHQSVQFQQEVLLSLLGKKDLDSVLVDALLKEMQDKRFSDVEKIEVLTQFIKENSGTDYSEYSDSLTKVVDSLSEKSLEALSQVLGEEKTLWSIIRADITNKLKVTPNIKRLSLLSITEKEEVLLAWLENNSVSREHIQEGLSTLEFSVQVQLMWRLTRSSAQKTLAEILLVNEQFYEKDGSDEFVVTDSVFKSFLEAAPSTIVTQIINNKKRKEDLRKRALFRLLMQIKKENRQGNREDLLGLEYIDSIFQSNDFLFELMQRPTELSFFEQWITSSSTPHPSPARGFGAARTVPINTIPSNSVGIEVIKYLFSQVIVKGFSQSANAINGFAEHYVKKFDFWLSLDDELTDSDIDYRVLEEIFDSMELADKIALLSEVSSRISELQILPCDYSEKILRIYLKQAKNLELKDEKDEEDLQLFDSICQVITGFYFGNTASQDINIAQILPILNILIEVKASSEFFARVFESILNNPYYKQLFSRTNLDAMVNANFTQEDKRKALEQVFLSIFSGGISHLVEDLGLLNSTTEKSEKLIPLIELINSKAEKLKEKLEPCLSAEILGQSYDITRVSDSLTSLNILKLVADYGDVEKKSVFLKIILKKVLPDKPLEPKLVGLLRDVKDSLSQVSRELSDVQKVCLLDICAEESMLNGLAKEEFELALNSITDIKEKTDLCKSLLLSCYFSKTHVFVLMNALSEEQKMAVFDLLTGGNYFSANMKERLKYIVYVLLGDESTREKLKELSPVAEDKTRLERWIEIEKGEAVSAIREDVTIIDLISKKRLEFADIEPLTLSIDSLLSETWERLIENVEKWNGDSEQLPAEFEIPLLQILDEKLAEENARIVKRQAALFRGEAALRLKEDLKASSYTFVRESNPPNQGYIHFYKIAVASKEIKSLHLYRSSAREVNAIKINGDDVFEATFELEDIDFDNDQEILNKVFEEERKDLQTKGLLPEVTTVEDVEQVIEESLEIFKGDKTGLYQLSQKIKRIYPQVFSTIFAKKSLDFCLENFPKFAVLVVDGELLIDAQIQNFLGKLIRNDEALTDKTVAVAWEKWINLFNQLEQKSDQLKPYLNASLVKGLNLLNNTEGSTLSKDFGTIPSSALDWLMHRIEVAEVFVPIRNRLIFQYILQVCAGEIRLENEDFILESIAADAPDCRKAIYEAIKYHLVESRETVPAAVCKVMLRHFVADQAEDFSVFKALMELPDTLDEHSVALWKVSIKSTLSMLDSPIDQHRQENIIALFKELFKYYSAEGKVFFDENGQVSDALAEIIYTIHTFTTCSIESLLEECNPKTKNELLGRSLGSISSFRRIHIHTKQDKLVQNKVESISETTRESWFGSSALAKIPRTERELSFGDTWHILNVNDENYPLAIVGHCRNAKQDPEYPEEIIEFLVQLPVDEKTPLEVYLWDRRSGSSSYKKISNPEAYLGEKTIQGFEKAAKSMQEAIHPELIEAHVVAVQNTVEEVFENPCRARFLRSNALLKALTRGEVTKEMRETIVKYGAIQRVEKKLGRTITQEIRANTSRTLAAAFQQAEGLSQFQTEFVWLKKSLVDPQIISELQSVDDFADIVNALRERVVFAIAYAKKVNTENQTKFDEEIKRYQTDFKKSDNSNKIPVCHLGPSQQKVVVEVGKDHNGGAIYGTYIISGITDENREVFEAKLATVTTVRDMQSLVRALSLAEQKITPPTLFVHPKQFKQAQFQGRFVEFCEQGNYSTRLWIPGNTTGIDNTDKIKIDAIQFLNETLDLDLGSSEQPVNLCSVGFYIRYLHLSNKLQHATWNIRRAENFSIDDWIKLEIEELRDNIRAFQHTTDIERAESILSAFLGEAASYQRRKNAVGSWLKYLAEGLIGGDVAQYESILSAYLPKRTFDVGKAWEAERDAIKPQMELYVFKEGAPILVGKVLKSFKPGINGKCKHELEWLESPLSYQYYALERKLKEIESDIEDVTNKIQEREREAFEKGAQRVNLYEGDELLTVKLINLESEREKIVQLMDAKKKKMATSPSREDLPYQKGQPLYTKEGRYVGMLDDEFFLERDRLFDKTTWFNILLNLSHQQLVDMGQSISVAILDIIQQGLLSEFYEEAFKQKTREEATLLKQKIFETFFEVRPASKPVLSAKDCEAIVKRYEPKAVVQIFKEYQDSNDREGRTRQEILKAMMLSTQSLPYFFATSERTIEFWGFLQDSHFEVNTIESLLKVLSQSHHPYKNILVQLLIATALTNARWNESIESEHVKLRNNLIAKLKIEVLPLKVIEQLPIEVRKQLLLSPQNFDCRMQDQYFDALSKGLTKNDLRKAFETFLSQGIHQPHVEQGMVAFYRNMKRKGCEADFWNIFSEYTNQDSAKRAAWIHQTMFTNLAFMQMLAVDVDQSNARIPYARYQAFTMNEIVDLIRLYKVTASEDQANFLANWLSKQIQNKKWRQENKKRCQNLVIAANDSVITREEAKFIEAVVILPSPSAEETPEEQVVPVPTATEVSEVAAEADVDVTTHDAKNLSELDSTVSEVAAEADVDVTTHDAKNLSELETPQTEQILSLVGDDAFRRTFQKKFPGMSSNLEALQLQLLKMEPDNFETFYKNGQLVLDAAEMVINLSFLESVKHQKWSLKHIDFSLLLSTYRLREDSPKSARRTKWRETLSDYIWTIDHIREKNEKNENNENKTVKEENTVEQLKKVTETLITLLDIKTGKKVQGKNKKWKDEPSDALITLLEKENFLLLMNLYKELGASEKRQTYIKSIVQSMFLAEPEYFYETLGAFDRQEEWDFVNGILENASALRAETEASHRERINERAGNRHVFVVGEAAALVTTATTFGMCIGHTLKFLLLGSAAATVVAVAHEAMGFIYDTADQVSTDLSRRISACNLGITSEKLDTAKQIYQDHKFERNNQKRKRSYGGILERINRYEKNKWLFGGRVRALWVRMGLAEEPQSEYISSYRASIPDLIVYGANMKLPTRAPQGKIILKRKNDTSDEYECLYGDSEQSFSVSLSTKFCDFLSVKNSSTSEISVSQLSKLDKESNFRFFSKKGTRTSFIKMLQHIESRRNMELLKTKQQDQRGKYLAHKTLVSDHQKAIATHRQLQQDIKAYDLDFSMLSRHLSLCEGSGKMKPQDPTNAKALLRSMQAALEIANLAPGFGKAHIATNADYVVSSKWYAGCFARLWNSTGMSWLTGEYLIQNAQVQELKKQLTLMTQGSEQDLISKGSIGVAQTIEKILCESAAGLISSNVKKEPSEALQKLKAIVDDTLAIWNGCLINKLNRELKSPSSSFDEVLGEVAVYLTTLVKTGMKIILLQENNQESLGCVERVANICAEIQGTIKTLKSSNKTALAAKMERMIFDVQYECSNIPQRLLLSRLDFLYQAFPEMSDDHEGRLVQGERENVRKEMVICCKEILREYPEDSIVRAKLNEIEKSEGTVSAWRKPAENSNVYNTTHDSSVDIAYGANLDPGAYEQLIQRARSSSKSSFFPSQSSSFCGGKNSRSASFCAPPVSITPVSST